MAGASGGYSQGVTLFLAAPTWWSSHSCLLRIGERGTFLSLRTDSSLFGGARMPHTRRLGQTRMTARQKAEDNGGAAAVHLAFGFLHDCLLG